MEAPELSESHLEATKTDFRDNFDKKATEDSESTSIQNHDNSF